ncbi:hypothetical protein BVRB_2g026680 [Beta vulgaris subsp. vulgaris]|uniref:uncharacterized protein LOC104905880 n=1 Tax=Beta vulgaris subsp. vulgaris TaxID=3555 RepID=UPI00065C3BEF|nr:uncharacterized protein LOC104905880 [Beta vulgaris subsp. vulgaris]KMT18530.1 hypothetical protein BVRB_2g026680 [Beta vulgaris subsp. vulgaris]
MPDIEIQLTSNGVVLSHLKNVKVDLSSDMYHLIVSNVRITTDKLDIIIPIYEAVLVLSRPDKRPSAYFVKCFLDLYDLSTLVRQNQAKRCFTSRSLRTSNWRC